MSKGTIQKVGTDMDLKQGPLNVVQKGFEHGRVQMTGSAAELSRRTTPMGEFDKHISGGTMEMMADKECTVSRTPRRGFESYNTAMSDNSQTPDSNKSSFEN